MIFATVPIVFTDKYRNYLRQMSFPQQQNLKNSFVDFNTIKPVNVLKPEATEKKSRFFPELLLKITLKETSVRKNGKWCFEFKGGARNRS